MVLECVSIKLVIIVSTNEQNKVETKYELKLHT